MKNYFLIHFFLYRFSNYLITTNLDSFRNFLELRNFSGSPSFLIDRQKEWFFLRKAKEKADEGLPSVCLIM